MKKHTIPIDGNIDYALVHNIAGSYGNGCHKELNLHVHIIEDEKRVWFSVDEHRKTIASVPSMKEAIDLYNKI